MRTKAGAKTYRGRVVQAAQAAVQRGGQAIEEKRRLPIGAEVLPEGGVHFRVWAPRTESVLVEVVSKRHKAGGPQLFPLEPEGGGYFSGLISEVKTGTWYRYRLERGSFPDPASRFQPEGPHGPSQVVDASRFRWSDAEWRGLPSHARVIYEMHIGTFTPEGTWKAAAEQLRELADLGLTVIEVLPIADFPGRFGWGYDGVDLFAPTRLYGNPDNFRAFVNQAHRLGLEVILDVVYNHLGPDGNYLKEFSEDYFTDRYRNEWGEALNFDGPESQPVREFFIANARYWIQEFHLDGLRLDATQSINDSSPEHLLLALSREVRSAIGARASFLVAENEPQHTRLVRTEERGGYGLDALWNDDFHHTAMVALTGRAEAYYLDYGGRPQEFISAMKWGYLYQGQRYRWQKQRRGSPSFGLQPWQFVNYLQNHDQVANSIRGTRAHELTNPGQWRALTALLLLGPALPMLFQGQEFAASTPFLYFADHNPELARLVERGREEFLSQFPSFACRGEGLNLANPGSEETFLRSKLKFEERETHAGIYRMHRDLLGLRKSDPVFARPRAGGLDGAVLGAAAFVLRFFGENGDDRLLLINLGADLILEIIPEPLLAPPEGRCWKTEWSSEAGIYGGSGSPPVETEANWSILGHSAVVMAPHELREKVNSGSDA